MLNIVFEWCIRNDAISLSKKVLEKWIKFGAIENLKNAYAHVLENSRFWEKTQPKKIKTLDHIFWPIRCAKKYTVTFFKRNLQS